MNLNRKSFTYRLFSWCYILQSKLWNEDPTNFRGDIIVNTNNNLCPMMRTIFLWTPVYLLTFLALLGGIGYIFVYLPNTYGGIAGYINTYLIPGIVIGLVAAFIYGIVRFVNWYDNKPYTPGETVEEMEARHTAGNYTFWEMICNYVRAVHEKTCPMITIVEDVKPEPAPEPEKAAPDQPVPATPPEDPQDIKTGPDEVDTPAEVVEEREAAEKAVDGVIEELDKLEPVKKEASNKNNSIDVKFLYKFAPTFNIFIAVACAIAVVAFLNWMMANVMQTDDVVFEKAACHAIFNVETLDGQIVCGAYTKTDAENIEFVAKYIQEKPPICEVTKGSLTDSISFNCEYK